MCFVFYFSYKYVNFVIIYSSFIKFGDEVKKIVVFYFCKLYFWGCELIVIFIFK